MRFAVDTVCPVRRPKNFDLNMQNKTSDLSQIEVCYCDSEAAWQLAVKDGLSSKATIRTANPSLLLNPPKGATVEAVDKCWTPEKLEAISACADNLVWNIRKTIKGSAFDEYADLLARDAFVWTYRIPWAITLDELDLSNPRAVVSVVDGNSVRDSSGHAQWGGVLAANPGLVNLTYQASDCGISSANPTRSPSRKQLLKFYPSSHLEYTIWRLVWQILPRSLSRGTVYVGIDNPGIRETLIHFARRGYAVCETQRPDIRAGKGAVPDELQALIEPLLREYLISWVNRGVQDSLIALFFSDLAVSLAGYDKASAQWIEIIGGWKNEKPVAFLSNITLPTAMLPLGAKLRKAGIPLVLFQHGHSREITKYLEFYKCLSEETFGDLFVCYDDKANEFATANRHRRASVITSGAPDLYHSGQRYIPDETCGDIGYIQTFIPVSNRASTSAMTWTDLEKDQFETKLFEHCLSRIPHTVTVKPYLAPAYPGRRKSIEVIEKSPNLNIYSKGLDLRYIIGNFRLIVTSRATSTLGWCLLANRPLVYLDLPYQFPLWDDARECLKGSVFFFDMSRPDSFDHLRSFLSQPMETIEQKWTEREAERKRFTSRYLDSGPRGFGKRTFSGIQEYLARRASI